jgi:acyl-CoA thioester hydrolase
MPRASLDSPPTHAYRHRFTVRPEHIDELGHAGNVSWIQWVNDAAIAHSGSIGLTGEFYREFGTVWVVRRHDIEYFASALAGELLVAATWVANMRGATSLRRTHFTRPADGKLLARAATTWALIEASSGRPRRVPVELMRRYGLASES